jgi:type II secretory ATPase GspE/PulE/Tfp pilus assembly ATPase PilB-like protein
MSDNLAKPDQWYFEIGDGQTYGPYPLEKLQKWAASGNLMPTHRVRRADSTEWTIAAYVPGLESTTTDTGPKYVKAEDMPATLGSFVRGLGRKGKGAKSPARADGKPGEAGRISAEPPDIVKLCDELLETAFARGASDIHIDPEENIVLIQLRIDGELETFKKLPKSLHPPVLGRLKVLSRMDIAEKRMAQDGQFAQNLGPEKRRINFRAATLPTTHGERMTLRLLAVETEQLTLNRLGMSEGALKLFTEAASQPQGMILLSGPTGSGKSTTLYAALRHRLAHFPGRFITVEEPVEYDIVGVAQVEVEPSDKVRFDTVLRNILRSDPDVIMIGEIRDLDTADVAIKAALTGHLVFSSIHTNSAASVITRFIDMGIQPFQVAATLRLCIAQRLVRRLCQSCRRPRQLTAQEAETLGRPEAVGKTIYAPSGTCQYCEGRGYKGRIGVFELLPIDTETARMIVTGSDEVEIAQYARQRKIPSMRDDAAAKLFAGLTSLEEIASMSAW